MSKASRLETDIPFLLDQLLDVGENAQTIEEKVKLSRLIRSNSKETSDRLDHFLIEQATELRRGLEEAQSSIREFEAVLEKLTAPPLHAAFFLGLVPIGDSAGAIVAEGTLRIVVRIADEIDPLSLEAGDEVLLGQERNVIVSISKERRFQSGETAAFDRYTQDRRLVMKHRDEEIVIDAAGPLCRVDLKRGDLVRWDRNVWMGFERIERPTNSSLFLDEFPDVTFEDIGGLSRQIHSLQRSLRLHLYHADVVRKYCLRRKGSVLLVGPPGTGKTMMAKALANWVGKISRSGRVRFMNVQPGELRNKWYGESEKAYRETFRIARQRGDEEPEVPVVIFFDEIDAIGSMRGSAVNNIDDRVLPALMAELDGLESRRNILVVAATNRRDTIDPALLRPGRLGDLVLEVPRPNMKAAREIFDKRITQDVARVETGRSRESAREEMIEAALARIYAPNADNEIASITFRDGRRRVIRASELMSGASITSIADSALELAAERESEDRGAGLMLSDVMAAIDDEFESLRGVLTPESCHAHITDLPRSVGVASVEPMRRKVATVYKYINVA